MGASHHPERDSDQTLVSALATVFLGAGSWCQVRQVLCSGGAANDVNRHDIVRNLEMLGAELHQRGVTGEIVIAGDAFMFLVVRTRETTKDVDAYFSAEPQAHRDAARVVAQQEGLPEDWLNDSVKGFFYQAPPVTTWAEYPGLRVFMVSPEYVLALKAIGARPADVPDLRALIDLLALKTPQHALDIVARYVPHRLVPPKAQYLTVTILDEDA
jgi:hypothetical protein